MPSLEGTTAVLDGNPQERSRAVMKCAEAAMKIGAEIFGVQVNIWRSSKETFGVQNIYVQ